MNNNNPRKQIEIKTAEEITDMVNMIFCFVKFKLEHEPERKFEAIKAADGIEKAMEYILDLPTQPKDKKVRLRDFLTK